jgi:hypothetical protein
MPRPSNLYLLGIAFISAITQTYLGVWYALAVGLLLLFILADPPQKPKQYIYKLLHPTTIIGEVHEKV